MAASVSAGEGKAGGEREMLQFGFESEFLRPQSKKKSQTMVHKSRTVNKAMSRKDKRPDFYLFPFLFIFLNILYILL